MENNTEKQCGWTQVVRWIARVWSIASIGIILLFIICEDSGPIGTGEWLGFLFFPLGVSVGMVLAWWKEGIGGGITVASLIVFYLVHFATAGTLPEGWAWLLFSAPGFLFLVADISVSGRCN